MNAFPGYAQIALIHQGETFVLYSAQEEVTHTGVFIKTPAATHITREILSYLENESQLKETLNPRWAIPPLRLVHFPDGPALLLEQFAGKPLDAFPLPLDLEHFLALSVKIAGAVASMHQQGLVHKDLKPSNIFVTGGGSPPAVRLTGFSIATRLGTEPLHPRHPERLEGTLAYMSPEQTGRLNRGIDHRSDLYSLGIVFYQMLTGHLPCEGTDILGWVLCHVAVQPTPPAIRNKAIPGPVSDIVMKLLAKNAEERYQTATCLGSDLERCLTNWRASGRIEPFPLAAEDVSERFLIPQKLYGRERELGILEDFYARVSRTGTPRVLLVTGYAGIGKTTLIQQLQPQILRDRGFFLAGKFDQLKRDTPYATLIQAFRDLVRQLLTESEEHLEDWRHRLQDALGINGQLLVEVIPELTLILGPQPAVTPLPLTEARNRFHRVFHRFMGVFARQGQPLVLFLDDLQWSDPSSLGLLEHLITHPDTHHLMLLGAYRDNEVTPTHPLMLTLGTLRKAGAALTDLVLAPLSIGDLGQLISDTLHAEPAAVTPLAELVYTKTGGNPFFFIQFLKGLHQEGLLSFDPCTARWRWDIGEIGTKGYTDNVVEFMTGKLHLLPPDTAHLLQLFACLGNKIDLPTLAAISGDSPERLNRAVGPAIDQGLVRWKNNTLEFLHDRIQQAAYLLTPASDRAEIHLKIGRLLLAHHPAGKAQMPVFDIVGQFNLARALIITPEERVQVAALNLEAGRLAKASSAYSSALTFLNSGLAFLGPECWQSRYAVAFGLNIETAECEWLRGNLEEARRRFMVLLDQAEVTRLDRARIHRDLIEVNTARGKMQEAIQECRNCLALFDQDLPPAPTPEQTRTEYETIWSLLDGRSVETLRDLPRLTDPGVAASLDAMAATIPAAVFTSESFLSMLLCRMVTQSVRHGNGESSIAGYVYFGMIVGQNFGNYPAGYQFGKLAYDLVDRGFLTWKSRVFLIFGNVINFWTRHMRTNLPYIHAAFVAGLELGDIPNACYCCNHLITTMLASGLPLEEVYHESEKRLEFVRGAHYEDIGDIIISQQRFILNMQGKTSSFSSFSDSTFDQEAFEEKIGRSQMALLPFWYGVLKLQARVFSGDFEEAVAIGRKASTLLWTSPAHIENAQFYFYHALALAACHDRAPDAQRGEMKETLERHRALLFNWAEACPENFRHRHDLLAAELARLAGRTLDAEAHYEEAIRLARENNFVQDLGLAYERAALFYQARKMSFFADAYLREARYCFLRWGAEGKARQLEHDHPQLGPRPSRLFDARAPSETIVAQVAQIDLLAVIKASQAIAGEIVLPKLMDTLLSVVLESAGALHATILLPAASKFSIAARASLEGGKITIRHGRTAGAAAQLPEAIVNYVIRTRETVLLDDASQSSPFSEAFAGRASKSVLCFPIIKQEQLTALLYLENDRVTGAFTPDRIAFLELLAGQSAISLDNARLYTDLQALSANLRTENRKRKRAEAALKRLNAELEQRIHQRTADLEAANKELEAFSYSVSHDLRAPLRLLDGFSQAILEDYQDKLDATGRKHLSFIRQGAQQMATLIDDMLRLSRIGRAEMRSEDIHLSDMAGAIAETLQQQDPARRVEWQIAPNLHVIGDRPLLRIAMDNLLSNAWKFTRVRAVARIEVGETRQHHEHIIFIRDNGAGFDMAYASKLFKPFQRLHSADEFPGTGIGLAIVQRIIERHGGRIWAEGAKDKGSTFFFTLATRRNEP